MPRLLLRSIYRSCTTPSCITATRVSCGVTLIRISSLILFGLWNRIIKVPQQLDGFKQRQTHHTGIAAGKMLDKRAGTSLYTITASLVSIFMGKQIAVDALFVKRGKAHRGSGEGDLDMLA